MKEEYSEQYPIVVISNNKAVTTSWEVARFFEKQHKDVLRAIRTLECSREFNERNFTPVEYTDEKGEKRPMYEMARDGFAMLAFGFTGPQAAHFKEAYIDAFNKMEEALRRIQTEALVAETKKNALAFFRKGVGLTALLQRRDSLEKVEQFYWFRVHGQLTHYEAAQVCHLEYQHADEIAHTLRDLGLALPMLQGQVRKKEMSRFFSEAVGGFLPEDVRACLADLRKEVAHE